MNSVFPFLGNISHNAFKHKIHNYENEDLHCFPPYSCSTDFL